MRQAEFAELSREVMPVLDKLTEIAGQHGTAEKLVSITLSAEGYIHFTVHFQVGEPHSTAVNPKKKRYSETYATFLKVGKGMWEYRGHCFAGENMDVEQYKNIAVCQ